MSKPTQYQVAKSTILQDAQKLAVENSSIQHWAYHIHQEKGGSDVENWLEAERMVKNGGQIENSLSTANRRGSGGGG